MTKVRLARAPSTPSTGAPLKRVWHGAMPTVCPYDMEVFVIGKLNWPTGHQETLRFNTTRLK